MEDSIPNGSVIGYEGLFVDFCLYCDSAWPSVSSILDMADILFFYIDSF